VAGAFSFLSRGGRIALDSRARKLTLLGLVLLLSLAYGAISIRICVAAYASAKPDLASLQSAVRLDPGNAQYQHQLGRFYFLVRQDATSALRAYQSALQLNPHAAQYWLSLAAVYSFLDQSELQKQALQRAIQADPRTPDVAWDAANFFLVRGENDAALREFRVVMESDPYLPPAALAQCWRVRPDADALLRDIVPPSAAVHEAFLELLLSRKETIAAAKVWAHLIELRQPMEPRRTFEYIHYLIEQQQVEQARRVWQQAAPLSGLSAYIPSSDNLVVNPDFSLEVLNGGFDWLYQKQPDVTLALDPTDYHGGHRSLAIQFDGQAVSDAGIRQLIPVQPNTTYDFSAYFKATDMQGSGGPRFAIQDFYTEKEYFTSDDLKDADFWKPVSAQFTTGPETTLLLLHIERFPQGSPIRGQLGVDDIRLVQARSLAGEP